MSNIIVNPGELRTEITIKAPVSFIDEYGNMLTAWENIFPGGGTVSARWVNAHGRESFSAGTLNLHEPATVTMRFSPLVTPKSQIYRGNDPDPFRIIAVDNVQDRGAWLVLTVERVVAAE